MRCIVAFCKPNETSPITLALAMEMVLGHHCRRRLMVATVPILISSLSYIMHFTSHCTSMTR